MTTTLAIDPGASQGWAAYEDITLYACGVGEPLLLDPSDRIVIERQQHYPTSPVDPNDLLTLALRAGEAAGRYGLAHGLAPEYVLPRVWKGAADKATSHRRIWHCLEPAEREIVALSAKAICDRQPRCPAQKGKKHSKVCLAVQGDMLDAIGIGLWSIGRKA